MDNAAVSGLECFEAFLTQNVRKELSQEVVVPDTMPDFAEVIESTPLLFMRSKQVQSGRAEVEACLAVTSVCRADDGSGVFSLETSIPFTVTLEDESILPDMVYLCCIEPACLEVRLTNPRKLSVKAEICGRAEVVCRKTEPIFSFDGGESGVYVKTSSAVITPIVSAGEKTFVLSDDYTLPPSRADAKQLLSSRVCVAVDEIRPIGRKLLFKGTAKCRFLYETVDGLCEACEFISSFSQIIETGAESSEPLCELCVMLTGAMFELGSGSSGRTINAELHFVAQCQTRTRIALDYISDAYSNLHPVELTTEVYSGESLLRSAGITAVICEELEAPGSVPPGIIDACVMPGVPEINGSEILLPLTLSAVVELPGGELSVLKKRTRASFASDASDGERLRLVGIDCSDVSSVPAAGGVEVRVRATAYIEVMARCDLTVVTKATELQEKSSAYAQAPSIVLMRAQKGGEWELAKACCSTVAAIKELNPDCEADASERRMLIIPKTR